MLRRTLFKSLALLFVPKGETKTPIAITGPWSGPNYLVGGERIHLFYVTKTKSGIWIHFINEKGSISTLNENHNLSFVEKYMLPKC